MPAEPSPEDLRFGEVAVRLKLLSRDQLADCAIMQVGEGFERRLGAICVEQGHLTPSQVEFVLEQQQGLAPRQVPAHEPVELPPCDTTPSFGAPVAQRSTPAKAPDRSAVGTERLTSALAGPRPTDSLDLDVEFDLDLGLEATAAAVAAPQTDDGPQVHPNQPQRPVSAAGNAAPPTEKALKTLHSALQRAAELGASDLHLHSGAPVLVRVMGQLQPLDSTLLDAETVQRTIAEMLGQERWQQFLETNELDFAYKHAGIGRYRVNAYMQQRGADVVLRLLPDAPPALESLGLPPQLSQMTDYRNGVVLCTGPVGCGKSTTLAALLNKVAQSRREHIITIEDPIEFVYPPSQALVNQRQVRDHTSSFARALKAALREDPDVIAITELRDRESISLAMTAAETGHLVLGSLHTGSAVQTITRMINAFPADQQSQIRVMLSESLRTVVSQRLVARRDQRGRVVAAEILMVTPAVATMIRDDRAFQIESAMQVGKAQGMVLLDDSLEQLVDQRVITKREAQRHATHPQRFG